MNIDKMKWERDELWWDEIGKREIMIWNKKMIGYEKMKLGRDK